MEKKPNRFETVLGTVVVAGVIAGIIGLAAGIIALIHGEWLGAGLCLGAAALAFGLIANAILRD